MIHGGSMRTVALLSTAALLLCVSATGAFGQMSPERDRGRTSESVKPARKVPDSAIARFRQGKELEWKGDDRGAVLAYEESAQAGYGLAQMRLAELYDRGNTAVKRDYQKALFWYEQARQQGLNVPKPHPYTTGR